MKWMRGDEMMREDEEGGNGWKACAANCHGGCVLINCITK